MDKTKQAAELFDKHAKLYQQKYMNVDLYADSLDLFCELVENSGAVLELACGPGNVTRYILNKRPDLKILGTDLAPNMLELARENNPEAVFTEMDCRDICKISKTYDAIICAFGLPYLSKTEAIQLIKDASKMLSKNGLFYLSFMENDNTLSGPQTGSQGDVMYINYHEAGYICEALEKKRINYDRPKAKNLRGG